MADSFIPAGPELEPSYVGIVYPWHCDHMGHMNVMWYVSKFDEATWTFFHTLGLAPSKLRERECGMAALEQHLTYANELHAGDCLKIFSRPTKVGTKSIHFSHQMVRTEDGVVASTCSLIAVHTDLQTRKSIALPENVVASAKELIGSTAKDTCKD